MMVSARSLVVVLLALSCGEAAAQTSVLVRPAPEPDHTTHVTVTRELSVSADGAAASGAPGVRQISSKAVLDYTQSNGRYDERDRMEVRLTINRFEAEETAAGLSDPSHDVNQVVGRSLTATVDRQGNLVEVRVPEDLRRVAARLRQLVALAYGALSGMPAATMTVGETTTALAEIPLPVPAGGTQAAPRARTSVTLRAIDHDGEHRIARLDQRIESAGDAGPLTIAGGGTIDVNLDRRFVAASANEVTVTTEFPAPAGGTTGQPGQVRATVRVTVDAKE